MPMPNARARAATGSDDVPNGARKPTHDLLNYRLAELPKSGKRTVPFWKDQYPEAVGKSEPAWADTYWPTSDGSHNARWQGANIKSPLEKYDAAFNNAQGCATYPSSFYGTGAKAEWDTYNHCAGPAAKWQTSEFQGGGEMHDGIDNDGDGKIDASGDDGSKIRTAATVCPAAVLAGSSLRRVWGWTHAW